MKQCLLLLMTLVALFLVALPLDTAQAQGPLYWNRVARAEAHAAYWSAVTGVPTLVPAPAFVAPRRLSTWYALPAVSSVTYAAVPEVTGAPRVLYSAPMVVPSITTTTIPMTGVTTFVPRAVTQAGYVWGTPLLGVCTPVPAVVPASPP